MGIEWDTLIGHCSADPWLHGAVVYIQSQIVHMWGDGYVVRLVQTNKLTSEEWFNGLMV